VDDMRQGGDPRLPLELALIKVTRPGADLDRESLAFRIEQLEQRGPATVAVAEAEVEVPAPATGAPAPPPLELDQLKAAWQRSVIPAVEERSVPTASVLREAQPAGIAGDTLTVEFPAAASFHRQLAEEPKNATLLVDALYEVTGRKKDDVKAKIYRMKLFAPNTVVARSRFWYFLGQIQNVKRSTGEILSVRQQFEKNANYVKNYGFWLRYDSRSGTHNMYKEYRDTTLTGAVDRMYSDLASRHRARKSSIQIVRTATIPANKCKRAASQQFHDSKIKFRLLHRIPRPQTKEFRSTFKVKKPCTFF